MLKRDSWRIIETILRRYPQTKAEYEDYISDIMSNMAPDRNIEAYHTDADYTKPQSITEAKALKRHSNYADRLKREINAVETAYANLKPEEQKVIRLRYWSGTRKPVPYLKISGSGYSERQMKRIVIKTVYRVGKCLGEVE